MSAPTGDAESPDDATALLPIEPDDAAEDVDTSRVKGWRRVFRSNRGLWITAAIAVVALVGGLLLGRFVLSPADAASLADTPDAGLITIPVELGVLSNDVTIRGEVGYADSVEVTVGATSGEGAAIVTGAVPESGSDLTALSVALEVTGRPVIVLPGELPAYRTLSVGMTGPDVVQFKQAMRAVGLDAGDPASDVFDAAAANAVAALYSQVGYPLPPAPEGTAEAVSGARESVRAAEQALASARSELQNAGSASSPVEIKRLDNAVASARRQLDAARAASPSDPLQIADLEDALSLAQLERSQANAAPDTSAQRAAVTSAEQGLSDAQAALAAAEQAALPFLPAGEVLYLTELPRRVDAVNVKRGDTLSGPAMVVSGATLRMTGSASPSDAVLLEVGTEATFEMPDGSSQPAVIKELKPGATDQERWSVILEPVELTSEQAAMLQGQNVRVSIAVGETQGEVLHVPVAAVTAGPGGESRVEVVDDDPRKGERAETRIVVVETGLAAGGEVEVKAVDGTLKEGDRVVVGR